MLDTIFKRLRGKKILIAGFGREGKSTLAFLNKYLPHATIGIADKNESVLQSVDKERYMIHTGDEYLNFLSDYDIVIKTPGLPLHDVNCDLSKISSQTDLFLEAYHNQIIGISGTKGKSTTSSLIYHLLKESGQDAIIAGNIGIPVFDCIPMISKRTIVVYELSAHQLQFIHKSPRVGVLLNVFEEHLDHFGTFENYKNAKINMLRYMNNADIGVLNSRLCFEAEKLGLRYVDFENYNFDDYQIDWDNVPLKGEHNMLNIKAALCACYSFGLALDGIVPHLSTFKPLEHRQEFVGVFDGVAFYNDSISTIPQAAIAALKTLKKVDFLLLGGYDRGIDYSSLIQYLNENPLKYVMVTGEAGKNIKDLLSESYKREIITYKDMDAAFDFIKSNAESNDVCLLSPAAASYDQYVNFEERGRKFKSLANNFKRNK